MGKYRYKASKPMKYKLGYFNNEFRLVDENHKIYMSSPDFNFVWGFAKNLMRQGHSVIEDSTLKDCSPDKIWGV